MRLWPEQRQTRVELWGLNTRNPCKASIDKVRLDIGVANGGRKVVKCPNNGRELLLDPKTVRNQDPREELQSSN